MKLWRLLDDEGAVIATVPFSEILDPDQVAAGRTGFGIYEAFDRSGHLLYTGRTSNLAARLRSHLNESAWWGFAVEIRWTTVENYGEAVALERMSISTDLGNWNVMGRRELRFNTRQTLPPAMARRVAALYAAADAAGRSADLDDYIATARHLGWSLQALGDVLSITREAIRLRSLKGAVDYDLVIPAPAVASSPSKSRKVWPALSEATRREMHDLQQKAVLVRGLTPIGHPNREASERLTEMIAEAKLRGVRLKEIAEAVGVSIEAIQKRLQRHGYMKNAPSQKDYVPGSGLEVRAGRLGESCERHHPGVAGSIRLVNGDPSRKVCRDCEKARVVKYRSQRGAA